MERKPVGAQRLVTFIALYFAAYLAASYVDLGSTSLGLQRPGVTEKNLFATDAAGTYLPAQGWLLTLGGAVVLLLCILLAFRNARRVDERWLRHPLQSFGKLYANPFSSTGLSVAPLHALSFALAFVVLRLLAGANNLLVYYYGWGPIGQTIKWLSNATSPLIGFCVVVFSLFAVTLVAMAPLAARVIRGWTTA